MSHKVVDLVGDVRGADSFTDHVAVVAAERGAHSLSPFLLVLLLQQSCCPGAVRGAVGSFLYYCVEQAVGILQSENGKKSLLCHKQANVMGVKEWAGCSGNEDRCCYEAYPACVCM